MRKVAVIGLGRFGMSLARRLGRGGVQVIAIDIDQQLVDDIKDDVDLAVRLDATDQQALVSMDVDKVDACVIAIGENFEATLLTLVIAQHLEIPEIICRAQTQFHAEILQRVGAERVIQLEHEAGLQLARQIANPHLKDFIKLSDGFTLIEVEAPQQFHGKTLVELQLRSDYGVNLVAIKRENPVQEGTEPPQELVVTVPRPDDIITPGDLLVLVGPNEALARLPKE